MTLNQDYTRIERAIEYLEGNFREQPELEDVARHVGLSPFHCQRLFTRWAGVSPKRFLQFLTVEHAKSLLAEDETVLSATYESGLSSAGRLHDLFVSIEAVTPGEYRSGGEGVAIDFGVHPTPFGEALVAVTDRGVCGLTFLGGRSRSEAIAELEARWPAATLRESAQATRSTAARVFGQLRDDASPPLAVLLKGTNFQLRVWEALLRIPAGSATTYEQVAIAAAAPRSIRATARAIGDNPIAFLIPCHRVLRKSGALGGYRWGTPRKQAMLAWESAHTMQRAAAVG